MNQQNKFNYLNVLKYTSKNFVQLKRNVLPKLINLITSSVIGFFSKIIFKEKFQVDKYSKISTVSITF